MKHLATAVARQGASVGDSVDVLLDEFFGEEGKQGIYRNPHTVSNALGTARSYIFSSDRAPNTPEDVALSLASAAIDAFEERVNAVLQDEWSSYRAAVDAAAITLVPVFEDIGDRK